VTRLTHDKELADAVHCGLGDAACPERVAAELFDLQSRPPGCVFEELADRIPVQAAPRYMSVAANGPEARAFNNSSLVESLTQCAARALLVRLRPADGDDDTVGGELQVTYIDEGKLRAAKSTCESNQNKSCVSKAEQVLTAGGKVSEKVREKGGSMTRAMHLSLLRIPPQRSKGTPRSGAGGDEHIQFHPFIPVLCCRNRALRTKPERLIRRNPVKFPVDNPV
jgi:hypothetical protein